MTFFSRRRGLRGALALSCLFAAPAFAAESFVDEFDRFDTNRWYVSDGWANGDFQNCTWSKRNLKLAEGKLTLSFEARKAGDRDNACAEVQTKQRFSYGTYEARTRTSAASGLNAAFFTYIGPANGQPHDEIDFEAITRDTSRIDVNTYVNGKPNNGSKVPVVGGTDGGFNDYAFVWEPDRIRWYVNGQLVHETKPGTPLPANDQKIFFSLWGTEKLTDWMGAFAAPEKPVTFEIERVAFTKLGDKCQFPESLVCKNP
ncbi:MAG: family 16 glycosylhydrolase [Methylobacterium mesophilicum]|nr:family 16 glycosylhydrolase [Methylobacterium mesophilicum]